MSLDYRLMLDVIFIVLLVTTIAYAVTLHRHLARLRNNRTEMDRASRSFAEAALRADAGIKALRLASEDEGKGLQSRIDEARALRAELRDLLGVAERTVTEGRKVQHRAAVEVPPQPFRPTEPVAPPAHVAAGGGGVAPIQGRAQAANRGSAVLTTIENLR